MPLTIVLPVCGSARCDRSAVVVVVLQGVVVGEVLWGSYHHRTLFLASSTFNDDTMIFSLLV